MVDNTRSRYYIMSSAIIDGTGRFSCERLTVDEVRDEMSQHNYISTVNNFYIINAFNTVINPPNKLVPNRLFVRLNPKDRAIVFRLTKKADPAVSTEELKKFFHVNHEIRLLEKID